MIELIAIVGGICIFSIIVLLLGSFGTTHDLSRKRVGKILNNYAEKINIVDEDLSKPLYERLIKPTINSLAIKITKYMQKKSSSKKSTVKQQSNKLNKMLRRAGMVMSVGEYALIRCFVIIGLSLFFCLIALFLGLGIKAVLGAILGAFSGYVIFRFNLKSKISERCNSMEQQMPDVLDLLSVNVEAGLGFDQALLHVIGHYEGALIDELTITYREMTMGRTRRDALTLFAERCELDEIKTFVGAIIQAEQLGISMKNVLRAQAITMRTSRRNKVEEKAQKVQVKMLLPMIGLIFPVLFIVLLGPAAVQIMRGFM